jgi:uncharacterized protein
VTFVDSNVPMYLLGAPHPHKADTRTLLDRLVAAGEPLVTDAEVLQEVLHRYKAIQRPDAIEPAFRTVLDLVDDVYPIEKRDVLRAAEIAKVKPQLSARDAIHVSVMERHGVTSILSFDADFDAWPGLQRIYRV